MPPRSKGASTPHLGDARFHLLNAEMSLERARLESGDTRVMTFAQQATGMARRLRKEIDKFERRRRTRAR